LILVPIMKHLMKLRMRLQLKFASKNIINL
jgi:hypothetical protein